MKVKIDDLEDMKLKDYLLVIHGIKQIPVYKVEETAAKYVSGGKKADREELRMVIIEQNLKQVISVAARYRGAGLSFASLIRAGNKGLIDAVMNLKEGETENISAYIVWCIEGAIIDALVKVKKTSQKKGW